MKKPSQSQSAEAPHGLEPPADIWDEFSYHAWGPALRFALDVDGAPKRCRRRPCKLAGECRMTWQEGKPWTCGGGLADEVVIKAAAHVMFASIFAVPLMQELRELDQG